jgi:hypothetical protein
MREPDKVPPKLIVTPASGAPSLVSIRPLIDAGEAVGVSPTLLAQRPAVCE